MKNIKIAGIAALAAGLLVGCANNTTGEANGVSYVESGTSSVESSISSTTSSSSSSVESSTSSSTSSEISSDVSENTEPVNIEDSIIQLNEYAKAAALTVKQIGFNNSWYNTKYTKMYGTAHTALCSDENGEWTINEDFNNKILTDVIEKTILLAFNGSEVLSKAQNCTVFLMFYMEEFVGASAFLSSDMDLFLSDKASVFGSYIVPTPEDFSHKSFLSWNGVDGCLKFTNGRLCPVGTYCFETEAPLGFYVPISLMGDWKAITVGGRPFEEYAKENSSKYTDWTNLTFSISEDALFLFGKTISTSRYDIIVSDGKYLINYGTNVDMDWGRIIVNDDGTLTLYLRHYFVNNDTSVPIILERCIVDKTNNQKQPPAITTRG